jgi:hypothetical protein
MPLRRLLRLRAQLDLGVEVLGEGLLAPSRSDAIKLAVNKRHQ